MAPAHVQTTYATADTTATTIAVAFASNVTAGNLLIVTAAWADGGTGNAPTITDTRGNTYTAAGSAHFDTPNGQGQHTYYVPSTTAGANTVTATFGTTTTYRRIEVTEVSGCATTSPVDAVSKFIGTSTTAANSVTSGSATTTTAGCYIYGAFQRDGTTVTITSGTGFTQRLNLTDVDIEDMTQASAGSVAATWTSSAATTYLATMVAFKPAGGGGSNLTATPADAVGVTDSVTVVQTGTKTPADTVGVADSAATIWVRARVPADAVGVTDPGQIIDIGANISDSVGVTDSASAVFPQKFPADAVGITDAANKTVTAARSADDAVGLADSIVVSRDQFASLGDTVGVTDSSSTLSTMDRIAADTVGVTDSVTAQRSGTGSASAADAIGITDSASVAADAVRPTGDTIGVTDSAVSYTDRIATHGDSASLTDSVATSRSADLITDDPVGVTDSVTAQRSSTGSVSAADNVGVTDSASTTATRDASAGDAVGVSDAVTSSTDRVASIVDSVGMVDSATVQRSAGGTEFASDSVGVTDVASQQANVTRSPDDAVPLTDAIDAARSSTATAADSLGISDVVTVHRTTPADLTTALLAERDINRLNTTYYISTDPTDLQFIPRAKVSDGHGGWSWVDPAPLASQRIRIITGGTNAGVERRTVDGEMVIPQIMLLLEWDAAVENGYRYTLDGGTYEVVYVNEDFNYEKQAEVIRIA
jgi:hypothetical protein